MIWCRLKVIGTVDLAYVRALCLNHTSPGLGTGSFPVDSHFLKDVWQQAAADLANVSSLRPRHIWRFFDAVRPTIKLNNQGINSID